MANFFDTLKADWTKFAGVVVKDEQIVRAELENIFGKDKVDAAIAQAEAAAKTILGNLAKQAVPLIESTLSKAAGSVKFSAAGAVVSALASAAGLNVSQSAIDTAIQTFVPFVASVAVNAVSAAL